MSERSLAAILKAYVKRTKIFYEYFLPKIVKNTFLGNFILSINYFFSSPLFYDS